MEWFVRIRFEDSGQTPNRPPKRWARFATRVNSEKKTVNGGLRDSAVG